jgi:hypothetical protein
VEQLISSRVSFFNLSMFRALLLLRETLFADGHLSLVNAKTQDFAKAFTVCLNQLDASGREQLEPKDRAPSEGHVRFTNMILSQVQLHDCVLMWQVAGRSMSASTVGNRPTEHNSCERCGNVRRWLLQHVFLPTTGTCSFGKEDSLLDPVSQARKCVCVCVCVCVCMLPLTTVLQILLPRPRLLLLQPVMRIPTSRRLVVALMHLQ